MDTRQRTMSICRATTATHLRQCRTATIRSVALPLAALTFQEAHDPLLSRERFGAMSAADRDRWLAAQRAINEAMERECDGLERETAILDAAARHNLAVLDLRLGCGTVHRVRLAQLSCTAQVHSELLRWQHGRAGLDRSGHR